MISFSCYKPQDRGIATLSKTKARAHHFIFEPTKE
jgi:hypothetical protein